MAKVLQLPEIEAAKKQAKEIRRGTDMPHHEALEVVARLHGAKCWQVFVARVKKAHRTV